MTKLIEKLIPQTRLCKLEKSDFQKRSKLMVETSDEKQGDNVRG